MSSHPTDDQLTTADGLKLHLRTWAPASEARGSVVLVHGLGEHIGRYAHVAQHLNDQGWHVVGHDHRGHGGSEGARGVITHPDDLLRDLAQVIDHVRAHHPGPLVLLGHSMGGLVAARFVAGGLAPVPPAWHRPVERLVLSSPALAAHASAVQKMLLAVVERLAPTLALNNGLKPTWISHDPAAVAAYQADPKVHDRISVRLARFVLGGGVHVRGLAARWAVPTLLMYAGSDRCVAAWGSAAFASSAPKAVVEAHEFKPLFHEIFTEAEVLARLSDWLAKPR